jgi:hypothetical protein
VSAYPVVSVVLIGSAAVVEETDVVSYDVVSYGVPPTSISRSRPADVCSYIPAP